MNVGYLVVTLLLLPLKKTTKLPLAPRELFDDPTQCRKLIGRDLFT